MMKGPIIIAHHLIWTGYGWWLPNDPRGSMSRSIACDIITELGELHYGRKRVQPASSTIRKFYDRAKEVLKHDLIEFSIADIKIIGESFRSCIKRNKYTCYACAIMPDHVHALIRRHRDQAHEMIHALQESSRLDLQKSRYGGHPIWGGQGWKVYLETPEDIQRTIRYVRNNPIKLRLQAQEWDFVTEYDGWPHVQGRRFPVWTKGSW
jgi:REP element-mobilizing transposase RayT